jgi:hypothetical protein
MKLKEIFLQAKNRSEEEKAEMHIILEFLSDKPKILDKNEMLLFDRLYVPLRVYKNGRIVKK